MDATLCNVIYVDSTIREDRVFRARSATGTQLQQSASENETMTAAWESKTLQENVSLLADVFGDVHLCGTGSACMARLFNLQDESMMGLKPTIVLIGTPHDERIPVDEQSRSPSPHSMSQNDAGPAPTTPPADEAYGLRLLRRIVSEAHLRNLSKLIVPVSVIRFSESEAEPADATENTDDVEKSSAQAFQFKRALNRSLLKSCLKLGATDVLFSPIQPQSITSLEIRAYWAHKSAARDQQALLELRRGRKRSWVGITDNRPYAYLRETMVASLMRRICQMEEGDELPVDAVRISVSHRRKQVVASSIGNWHFSAHDFDDDELVEASALMFKHALAMPELAEWRIPTEQLICFLVACRAAYNSFVPYHNFRHVVDVLQATFNFLVNIGALPPYPHSPHTTTSPFSPNYAAQKSPMASLIRPFEALTLLITAIGHDVGHPGVNNGFLVLLNTPLAQLYNDRSVLESFHCAAYSQILRRYWPAAFNDSKMRNLMTSSILATDMGLHFDYMKKLGNVQEKLAESDTTDGWNGRMIEDHTSLACALLIKCADISNVARRHDTALQWMHILSDEFSRQAFMENQLSIKSSLASQPKKDTASLFRAQLGFMNLFAIPLFQGIASVMPTMQYCVDELELNKALFERGVLEETGEETSEQKNQHTGVSPRSTSVAVPTDSPDAHPKNDEQGQHPALLLPTNGTAGGVFSSSHDNCGQRCNGHIDTSDAVSPTDMPALGDMCRSPNGPNGPNAAYDPVAEFVDSDPFGINDGRPLAPSKQRVSEATDGSTSLPGGGDWASQATSATTGKMPLSPSTQGTSIISRDSMDRPSSLPITSASTSAPKEIPKSHSEAVISAQVSREDESSLSSGGLGGDQYGTHKSYREEPLLKKKSSRFRMNAFTFFRRHLSPSPPLPTSNNANSEPTTAQDSCR